MSCAEKPHPSELVERCGSCSEPVDLRGECCTVGCVEYEIAVHGPIRYEVQFSGWSVPCATFRRAIDLRAGQGWSRVVRWGYAPVDEDDDGLNSLEREALELPPGDAQDVLVAVIDGLAAQAA